MARVWNPDYTPPDWKSAFVASAFRAKDLAQKVAASVQYVDNNHGKELERYRTHYASNQEKCLAYASVYRDANREQTRVWARQWAAGHKEEKRISRSAYNAAHREERKEYWAWWSANHQESIKGRKRARREAPFSWSPLEPWPNACQICFAGFPPDAKYPADMVETIGHEPPVAWMLEHPDYDGPLILRPEHWACNIRKHAHPDWENFSRYEPTREPKGDSWPKA